jgi:hypothetical protein
LKEGELKNENLLLALSSVRGRKPFSDWKGIVTNTYDNALFIVKKYSQNNEVQLKDKLVFQVEENCVVSFFSNTKEFVIHENNEEGEVILNNLEYKKEQIKNSVEATQRAKKVLKIGDRIGCNGCGGTKRTITISGWDGNWIVSKSGIDDIHASHIYKWNGMKVNFSLEEWRLEC